MVNYANRGKKLERLIDFANKFYSNNKYGSIVKLPHPFQTLKVKGSKVEGFFKRGYLVDYVGASQGDIIIFDAKELHGKSFPFSNVTLKQVELLYEWSEQGAKSFLLVHFKDLDRYFKLNILDYVYLEKIMRDENKKSINIKYFESHATEVFVKDGILDYLEMLN